MRMSLVMWGLLAVAVVIIFLQLQQALARARRDELEKEIRLDMLVLHPNAVLVTWHRESVDFYHYDTAILDDGGYIRCYSRTVKKGAPEHYNWYSVRPKLNLSVLDVHYKKHEVAGYDCLPPGKQVEYLSHVIPWYLRHVVSGLR